MSTQKLKQLKLYKKLEKDLTYRQKLQQKIRQISKVPTPTQSSSVSKKINNNKKYFKQQEINALIQRENRILFEKIQLQGMRSHYYNKSRAKNRSSKTLNSMQQYDQSLIQRNNRKYNNLSQNKIHYLNQQHSRISFQQNEQKLKPKIHHHKQSKRIMTQLSPQLIQMFKSRLVQNKSQKVQNETILFQGIAQIDGIRFKVKISIKNKIYLLTGKNKHTQIMLKMQLNQYKKFHKQVLMGNPSHIFQYLVIDKGKIRFRTLQEQQQLQIKKKQQIYQINQQDDEDNQQQYRKYKPLQRSSKYINPEIVHQYQYLEDKYPYSSPYQHLRKQKRHQERNYQRNMQRDMDRQIFQPVTLPLRNHKNSRSHQKSNKKENIFTTLNKKSKQQSNEKYQKYEKYRTLQDYINDKDVYHSKNGYHNKEKYYQSDPYQQKDGFNSNNKEKSNQSTEVQVRYAKKDRYKLPYL